MRKIIKGVTITVLIGTLGWNTYSVYQLREQVTKQDTIVATEKNYEEYIPVERNGYSNEEDTDEPYMLLLIEEVKNEEDVVKQKDLGRDIDNTTTYIMNGSGTLCYSSRDKIKD